MSESRSGFCPPFPKDSHPGSGRRVIGQPDVFPDTIRTAPLGFFLSFVEPGFFGLRAESVDADLKCHRVAAPTALGFGVPALDGVDLFGERIEPLQFADLQKQSKFVV